MNYTGIPYGSVIPSADKSDNTIVLVVFFCCVIIMCILSVIAAYFILRKAPDATKPSPPPDSTPASTPDPSATSTPDPSATSTTDPSATSTTDPSATSKTTPPPPASTPAPSGVSKTSPPAAPVVLPGPFGVTLYGGDNGSVNGNDFCLGDYGAKANKNMVCLSGIDNKTGLSISCDKTYGDPNENCSYYCASGSDPHFVPGDNGTVTGDEFCRGSYGASADKNMICIRGVNYATNKSISCSQGFPDANQANGYYCASSNDGAPNMYRGNNGTVSGDAYCKGGWGNATGSDKNMTCLGGMDLGNKTPVSCSTTPGLTGRDYGYICV